MAQHPLAIETMAKIAMTDEPIFILRAQDIMAPLVIRYWIELNEKRLGVGHEKIVAARQIAADMEAWPNRKEAD